MIKVRYRAMRKQSNRKPIKPSHPMLVNRHIEAKTEQGRELAMITAFKFGAATVEHYDFLCDMANLVLIATTSNPNKFGGNVAESLIELSILIKQRFDKVGKYGVNGEQLTALIKAVENYDIYWKSQTTSLYNNSAAELQAFMLKKNKEEEKTKNLNIFLDWDND